MMKVLVRFVRQYLPPPLLRLSRWLMEEPSPLSFRRPSKGPAFLRTPFLRISSLSLVVPSKSRRMVDCTDVSNQETNMHYGMYENEVWVASRVYRRFTADLDPAGLPA